MIGRRTVLAGLLASFGRGGGPAASRAHHPLAVFSDLESARAIGRICLRAMPATAVAVAALERLLAEMPSAAALQGRIREDFAAERIVVVDRWMLSETEARLYQLAALS